MVAFASEKSHAPLSVTVDTPRDRRPDRFQRNRPPQQRQFLNVDNQTYYFDDLDTMESGELADLREKIEDLVKCLEETVDKASGDTQIKARDKLRHCNRFLDGIAGLLDAEPEGDGQRLADPCPESKGGRDEAPRSLPPPPPPLSRDVPPTGGPEGMVTPVLHRYVKKERDQLRASLDALLDAMRHRLPPDVVDRVMKDAGMA